MRPLLAIALVLMVGCSDASIEQSPSPQADPESAESQAHAEFEKVELVLPAHIVFRNSVPKRGFSVPRANPRPVLPVLWEDPAFWDEIYMRSARDGSGLPDAQSRRRRR